MKHSSVGDSKTGFLDIVIVGGRQLESSSYKSV